MSALIAIVDGAGDVADILSLILEEAGFRTVVESHENLAQPAYLRQFLEDRNPWLFLWDIPPPVREQWLLLERVRRAAPHQGFVVTSTNRAVVERLALPGRFELLSKPFDIDEMLRAIHRVIDRRRVGLPGCWRATA